MTKKTATGWLLDVYISRENAVLWIKLKNGKKLLRLIDKFKPNFFIKPKTNVGIEDLEIILQNHPNIIDITHEARYTSIDADEKTIVLNVHVDSIKSFRRVLFDIKKLGLVKNFYNIDILHIQRYLFQKGVTPSNKVETTYNEKNRLLELRILDDSLEVKPPPFTWLIFSIEMENHLPSSNVENDRIANIIIADDALVTNKTISGGESKILTGFAEHITKEDPDILVAHNIDTELRLIFKRARVLGLNLNLGREEPGNSKRVARSLPHAPKGRATLNLRTFIEEGIAGVVERTRFTVSPISLSAKWRPGKMIDSRQCFESFKRGILLPKACSNFRYVTTAKDVVFRDRGALILSPRIGLHENVGELDFESMFPNIIIEHNLSYETVTPYFVDKTRKGLLGEITKYFLKRRLYFKHLRKLYPKNSLEWTWCDQRQSALKGVLVCIYGYSGCFANRFSNVAAYEEINRVARKTLVKTINIAVREGFEVIYADSDSVFVKKKDAKQQDYEKLAQEIHEKTGLSIALDNHYKFLILLPQEADPNMEATRRYFGKLMNGDLHYRGIQLRRRDYPLFIKQFQEELIGTLFNAESTAEIKQKQLKKAFNCVEKTCADIIKGNVEPEKLIVSKVLRKPVTEYRSMLPHVVATIQLLQKGKKLKTGEKINFLYVNATHTNPFRRVVPASLLKSSQNNYDREKYREMVVAIAKTVLGTFGFECEKIKNERTLRCTSGAYL